MYRQTPLPPLVMPETIPFSSTDTPAGLGRFLDRRSFLRSSAATGAGLYLATSKGAIAQGEAADRPLTVALVGCGAQGDRLRVSAKDIPGIQWVAICDIWEYNRRQIAARLKYENKEQLDGEVALYTDIEEMLAKEKNLDCVIIATPDFLHAPYTRLALEAGKMVYCEKMMSNTIEAAADMVKSQRETGGLLQIGHQRHSNPRYLHLRDNVLAANLMGRITHCYGQWNRGVSASQPLGIPKGQEIAPDVLAKSGYDNMEEFRNWRWYRKYGGGPISDLGAHQIDLFNWFFKAKPVSVSAVGGVDYYDGTDGKAKFELPDNVMALYEYKLPTGTMRAYYQVLTTTGSQGYYEKLLGVDGSAVISESPSSNQIYREPSAPDWSEYAKGDNPLVVRAPGSVKNKYWETERSWEKPKPPSYALGALASAVADVRESKALDPWELPIVLKKYPHTPHLENFFEAARKRDQSILNCPVLEAYHTCVTVLRCYDSIKSGSKYVFKPSDFDVA